MEFPNAQAHEGSWPNDGPLAARLSPTGAQYPKEIAGALGDVLDAVKPIAKDGNNKFQNYDYASIDKFLQLTGPACAAANLIVKPIIISCDHEVIETMDSKSGQMKPRRVVNFWFKFRLIHTLTGVTFTDEEDRRPLTHDYIGPQTTMSAESYALKSFFRTLFQIPTGDKDVDEMPQWSAEQAATKAEVRASKKRRETGVDHVSIDFGQGLEEIPIDEITKRILTHLVGIGDIAEGREWWKSQEPGRAKLHEISPRTSMDLKRAVEKFFDGLSKQPADDEPPFQNAAE